MKTKNSTKPKKAAGRKPTPEVQPEVTDRRDRFVAHAGDMQRVDSKPEPQPTPEAQPEVVAPDAIATPEVTDAAPAPQVPAAEAVKSAKVLAEKKLSAKTAELLARAAAGELAMTGLPPNPRYVKFTKDGATAGWVYLPHLEGKVREVGREGKVVRFEVSATDAA